MRTTGAALAALLTAFALPAQGGKAAPTAAQTEYQKLVAESAAANAAYSAAMRKLTASEEYIKAEKAKDQAAMTKLHQSVPQPDQKGLAARAMKLADQFAGEERVPFLCWAASNSGNDKEIVKTAVAQLLQDHLKSPRLVELAENGMAIGRALGVEASNAMLARLVAESGDAQVVAWAKYWQATQLTRGRDVPAENKAKADVLLAEAGKLAAGTSLGERIAAPQFEKDRLQIGMEVPDIVGEDVDGVPFKLSDYRGKVVVLDFWGFW